MKHIESFSMDFDKCVKCGKETKIGLMVGHEVHCLDCYEKQREENNDEL